MKNLHLLSPSRQITFKSLKAQFRNQCIAGIFGLTFLAMMFFTGFITATSSHVYVTENITHNIGWAQAGISVLAFIFAYIPHCYKKYKEFIDVRKKFVDAIQEKMTTLN